MGPRVEKGRVDNCVFQASRMDDSRFSRKPILLLQSTTFSGRVIALCAPREMRPYSGSWMKHAIPGSSEEELRVGLG